MTLVVGLDLAGVERRPSGFCVLWGVKATTSILHGDEEIVRSIGEVNPEVVAIDAPLSLPPGRRSIEDRTGVHLRECDRELLRRRVRFFPVTLGPMRKLTERGIGLRRRLEADGFRVIEVYPGGAQDVLGIPRKGKGLGSLLGGLRTLGIEGLTGQMTHDELDAVTSAYVAKLFVEGRSETLGDAKEGIVMPRIGP